MCSEKASLVTAFLSFIQAPMQCHSVMTSSTQLRWLISVNITVFSQVQLALSPAGWWDGSIGLWKRQSCESSCKSVMCLFVCMCVCTWSLTESTAKWVSHSSSSATQNILLIWASPVLESPESPPSFDMDAGGLSLCLGSTSPAEPSPGMPLGQI